ncbi:MAG: hypothetical protein ACI8UZ_002673 [Akkermansiaceae bacterium]
MNHILKKDEMRSTLLDDAQLWLGVSYNYEGNQEMARKEFGVLLRDFPASSLAKHIKAPPPGSTRDRSIKMI